MSALTARAPRSFTRSRQQTVLVLGLLTVLVESANLLGAVPDIWIGRIPVSAAVVPGAAILWVLGSRALGRPLDAESARPFWLAALVGIGFGVVMLARDENLADALGLGLAAMGEEVVYRFAVPAVVAAMLLALHVPVRTARVGGFVVAAVWFVLLPGHRAQVDGLEQVLPFIAFATLAAVVVYRSGSLYAAGATHWVMNMLTVLTITDVIGNAGRMVTVGALLLMLVSAYGLTRTPQPTPAPATNGPDVDLTLPMNADAVIDLRDGVEPTVTDADGTVTLVHDPARDDSRVPDQHR